MSVHLDIEGKPTEDATGNNVCQGCAHTGFPGIRYPATPDGDNSRPYVERCDYCERYERDLDAALHLVANGVGVNIGQSPLKPPWLILRMNIGEQWGDEFYKKDTE